MSTAFRIEILKEEIENLESERINLEKRLSNITRELITLQNNCDHKNEDDSNSYEYHSTNLVDDFYKCTICGYIKKKK